MTNTCAPTPSSSHESSAPVVSLAAFYTVFFVHVGLFGPYWPLFLQDRGLDPFAIGSLVALSAAMRLFAPYFWGALADRRGRRLDVIRLSCSVGLVCFVGIALSESFWALVACLTIFAFFWNATLPQFEALTLAYLGRGSERYARIRLWGSVGFIVAVMLGAQLLDLVGIRSLPWMLCLVIVAIFAVSMLIREPAKVAQSTSSSAARPLLVKGSIGLLVASFLMQLSHGPYYTFFSIQLESLTYSRFEIGVLWSLGVIAEIALFALMPQVLRSYSLRGLFIAAYVLTTVRWIALANWADVATVVAASQLLHAASYGLHHAVAMQFIVRLFPAGAAGRAQALYACVGFGAGSALGGFASGLLWQSAGPGATWMSAAVASGLGAVVVWMAVPGDSRTRDPDRADR